MSRLIHQIYSAMDNLLEPNTHPTMLGNHDLHVTLGRVTPDQLNGKVITHQNGMMRFPDSIEDQMNLPTVVYAVSDNTSFINVLLKYQLYKM